MADPDPPDSMVMARLMAARLCHDLGGVSGTLTGTLDLVGEAGDLAMLDLARETAQALRLRLRLYAAAWAGASGDLDAASMTELLAGSPAVPRVAFVLDGLAAGAPLPAALVPLALNAALLGAEALPRGGTVRLAGDAASGLVVRPEGKGANWPAALVETLAEGVAAGEQLEEAGPRRMLAPLVALLAEEAGWRASLALGGPDGAGAAPLVLGPG